MNFKNYQEFNMAKEKCRECSVGLIYNKVVLSDGCHVNPIIIIIGEACGSDEILAGSPFVGKAGKLLRATLNKYGYKKSNSLITNTIPCRPENNKFPADSDLVNNCVNKWLRKEIELTMPKYMLLIGATPTKYLLGLTGITKLRGQWFEYKDSGVEIPCMPTLHPSYVLRKQYMKEGEQIKADFVDDIKSMAKKAGFKI